MVVHESTPRSLGRVYTTWYPKRRTVAMNVVAVRIPDSQVSIIFHFFLTRNPRQHVHAKTGVEGGRAKVPENAKFGANDPIEALSFRGGR